MTCIMPELNLPPDFETLLENITAASIQKKKRATDENGSVFTLSGSMGTASIHFGVQFDGLATYDNINSLKFQFFSPPIIPIFSDVIDIITGNPQLLRIQVSSRLFVINILV